jgi:hypothetical protein
MRTSFKLMGLVASAVVAAASTALGTSNGYHGSICAPANSLAQERARRVWSEGIFNNSTQGLLEVYCGGSAEAVNGTTNVDAMGALAFDRNPAAGQDVCCFFDGLNDAGWPVVSAQRCTSGASGNVQVLLWGGVPNNASSTTEVACTIPMRNAQNEISSLFSYGIRNR